MQESGEWEQFAGTIRLTVISKVLSLENRRAQHESLLVPVLIYVNETTA